ncbi:unnamed protein product [Polarella glacialis]|uniref:RING-type domain-containing protein n=1 Tax=Polarella glacialis TaxID=89957 RepID=A0A813IDC9_POLGL|nr:unnamed protein product [Polarella glacialis]
MDFLQQLIQVSSQASEEQYAEQDRAANALMEGFQEKCLVAAEKGETDCRYANHEYFLCNWGKFPNNWQQDSTFQDEFAMLLSKKLRETFGPNSRTSASVTAQKGGIELAAIWPKPRPTGTAAQHSSSRAPRSNLNSQCPVCLCRAEVVALTPCGHVLCVSCSTNFDRGTSCPVCRESVAGRQNLFS